jgi:hypothetical protein
MASITESINFQNVIIPANQLIKPASVPLNLSCEYPQLQSHTSTHITRSRRTFSSGYTRPAVITNTHTSTNSLNLLTRRLVVNTASLSVDIQITIDTRLTYTNTIFGTEEKKDVFYF